MACLTDEQLAAIALQIQEGETPPHIHACVDCRAKLAEMERTMRQLAAAHAWPDSCHLESRARLLASLPIGKRPSRPASLWQRFAFGGIGLSAAVALVLLAVFANSTSKLSAMERMVKAIREVRSYSFQQLNTTTYLGDGGKPQVVRHEIGYTCWRAPGENDREWLGDFYADIKSWRVAPEKASDTSEPAKEKLQLYLSETYPCGKPGLMIAYSEGLYFWTPPLRASEILNVSPQMKLLAVREGQGRIVRELGTRTINGREASGYIMDFQGATPFKDFDPVEVWLDPKTDLPMEVSYRWAKEQDKYTDVYRMSDIRWNIDIPSEQFATVAPLGLIDTTPPNNEADISSIVEALKLYAELSGGRYPGIRTTYYPGTRPKESDPPYTFDANAVKGEMLKLAGFTGPPQAKWSHDAKFQQIEAAATGLERLSHVLLDPHHAGFFGDEVDAQDGDKVLFWWRAGTVNAKGEYDPEGYSRVFYGDLRTEVLSDKDWMKLMPPEFEELMP